MSTSNMGKSLILVPCQPLETSIQYVYIRINNGATVRINVHKVGGSTGGV